MADIKVLNEIKEKIEKRPLYFPFIDSTIYNIDEVAKIAKDIGKSNADSIVVGGTLNVNFNYMNEVVKRIKENVNLPVILLPSNSGMVSKYADALFFISLLNSRNPYWITGVQALTAPLIQYSKTEVIPTAYLVIEPGGTSSWIGDANPIPRDKPQLVKAYSLYAKFSGKEVICIDTGMGTKSKMPEEIIKNVKETVDLPLAFYGGVKTMNDVKKLSKAGANIIITNTIIKKHKRGQKLEHLVNLVRGIRIRKKKSIKNKNKKK